MEKPARLLAGWAGLMGACGVAAAAASAHVANGANMGSVALILLAHAGAILALTAPRFAGPGLLAAGLMAIGASLFGADVSLLTLAGRRLFPMAAPTGGSLLIFAWLVAAFAGLRQR
jgi:uncharacterized membrane protein YgdD (TMEM256/DUF423 family)